MTCKEIVDFLMDYLDGQLPAAERSVFERHLKMCPDCVDYLNSYRSTIRLAKDCAEGDCKETAGPVPERLIQAILAARRRAEEPTA